MLVRINVDESVARTLWVVSGRLGSRRIEPRFLIRRTINDLRKDRVDETTNRSISPFTRVYTSIDMRVWTQTTRYRAAASTYFYVQTTGYPVREWSVLRDRSREKAVLGVEKSRRVLVAQKIVDQYVS